MRSLPAAAAPHDVRAARVLPEAAAAARRGGEKHISSRRWLL